MARALPALALMLSLIEPPSAVAAERGYQPFTFAAIGDTPYLPHEVSLLNDVLSSITLSKAKFVVHVGDIKSGSEPCTDRLLSARKEQLDNAGLPLFFTPGDNEWTDCHRSGFQPEERLEHLRDLFFSTPYSLGAQTLPLSRQSENPRFREFRENARWIHEGVVFVTLNVSGSNNHWRKGAGRNEEFQERRIANATWLTQALEFARSHQAQGLVVIFHANPEFERPLKAAFSKSRDGFQEIRAQLQDLPKQFAGPILLIHGDTHTHRIDHPVSDRHGRPETRVTRLEVFGSPYANAWAEIDVDANRPTVFQFKSRRLRTDAPTP